MKLKHPAPGRRPLHPGGIRLRRQRHRHPRHPGAHQYHVAAEENRTELPVNGSLQLTATGLDQDGGQTPTGPLAWSSADTTRAGSTGRGW